MGSNDPGQSPAKKMKVDERGEDVKLVNGTEIGLSKREAEGGEEEDDDFHLGPDEDEKDDETTLNEEEKEEDTNANEVIELQEEGDLPIEELLQRYGYSVGESESASSSSSSLPGSSRSSRRERRAKNRTQDMEEAEGEGSSRTGDREALPSLEPNQEGARASGSREAEESGLLVQEENVDNSTQGSCSSSDREDSSERREASSSLTYMMQLGEEEEDSEDDADYVPPEMWKKEPRVGEDFQVPLHRLPSPTHSLGDEGADTRGEQLLWKPQLPEEQVEEYLRRFFDLMKEWHEDLETRQNNQEQNGVPDLPEDVPSSVIKDDDDALTLLLQNDYDADLSLTKQKNLTREVGRTGMDNRFLLGTNPDGRQKALEAMARSSSSEGEEKKVLTGRMWTDESSNLFEEGLRRYGKNFLAIRNAFFPKRRTGDLVEYYYAWKKTERHDVFVQRVRFEKHRMTHNPNATDFMENFMNQMDGTPTAGPPSISHPFPGPSLPPPPPPMETEVTQGSSLISSDPKHAVGLYHVTHYNEWQSPKEEDQGPLPHLDSEVVDQILET